MRWAPYYRFAIVATALLCSIFWLRRQGDLLEQVNGRVSDFLDQLPIYGSDAALNQTYVEAEKEYGHHDFFDETGNLIATTTSMIHASTTSTAKAAPTTTSTSRNSSTVVTDAATTSKPASENDVPTLATELAELISAQLGDKVVVMGKMKDEDTSWVANKLSDWQSAIYHVDEKNPQISHDPPFLTTPKNKGHEAMPYLTYIVDHYDSLPMTVAFIHSHEKGWPKAWHTDAGDYSNANSLRKLNIDFVQRNGYANLRCLLSPGCPSEIQPARISEGEVGMVEQAYAEAWKYIFQNTNVPDVIATPCCAQFAVSRKQIRQRPKEFYVRARDWVLTTDLDDATSGRILEYMWHIMFGMEAV